MIIEQHLAWKDAVQHQAGAYPDFRPCEQAMTQPVDTFPFVSGAWYLGDTQYYFTVRLYYTPENTRNNKGLHDCNPLISVLCSLFEPAICAIRHYLLFTIL